MDIEQQHDLDTDLTLDEIEPPRRRRRSIRQRQVRKKTLPIKRISREDLAIGRLMYPPVDDAERPRTRDECRGQERPCPWVGCKHHLYLDVNPETGSITINFPDLEPWELKHTCALDIAEVGGITLEEVGEALNITRERVRQIEVRSLVFKMKPTATRLGMHPSDYDRGQSPLADAQDRAITMSASDVTSSGY